MAPATGGEAAQVTDAPLGASAPAWSPDSASLVYLARVPDHGRYGTLEGVPAPQEDPRHLTGYQIQANGLGWLTDRIAQLFVVATPDPYAEPPIAPVGRAAAAQEATSLLPASRQLTHGASDVESAFFTPDGSGVVIVTQRGADLDVTVRSSLYRVDVATGEETPVLADGRISYVAATYSADGAHLYALGADMGEDGVHFSWQPTRPCTSPMLRDAPRVASPTRSRSNSTISRPLVRPTCGPCARSAAAANCGVSLPPVTW
ncbi:TolB family protein [Propioniciclava flava]